MRITRLRITNYRGVRALDVEVPPAGAIVKGKNGRGKTTVLKAIRAALAANDIGPDAITIGEEKSEILIDLDAIQVRRGITASGSTVTVSKDVGGEKFKAPKPTTYLAELLGTSPLDPLDLVLEKDRKKRRARVLGAMPLKVTREQVLALVPDLPADFSVEGHGLEVLERARKHFYDRRTEANKRAADAKREAERLHGLFQSAFDAVKDHDGTKLAAAEEELLAARANVAAKEQACKSAEEATARTAKAREEIEKLTKDVAERRDFAAKTRPRDEDLAAATQDLRNAEANVRELEATLEMARKLVVQRTAKVDALRDAEHEADEHDAAADRNEGRAKELADAIAAAVPYPPPAEEIAAAKAAVEEATRRVQNARNAAEAKKTEADYLFAQDHATSAAAVAEVLDKAVKALTDAPSKLLEGASAIPGLSIDDEDVMLDGKRLDALCGAEQMVFAVEIARRLNAKVKLLVVDGLERLDPDQLEVFVREATRDGYQLIASRVDRGELVVEAIERAENSEAAE